MKVILEMEMPESCADCIIAQEMESGRLYCPILCSCFSEIKYETKRRENCPLKSV